MEPAHNQNLLKRLCGDREDSSKKVRRAPLNAIEQSNPHFVSSPPIQGRVGEAPLQAIFQAQPLQPTVPVLIQGELFHIDRASPFLVHSSFAQEHFAKSQAPIIFPHCTKEFLQQLEGFFRTPYEPALEHFLWNIVGFAWQLQDLSLLVAAWSRASQYLLSISPGYNQACKLMLFEMCPGLEALLNPQPPAPSSITTRQSGTAP